MKTGIVGLPGAGKTTVFEALTRIIQDVSHRGEPRMGAVTVPDQRVDVLSKMYNPRKTTYAQVEYFLPALEGQKKDSQSIWNQVRDCDALLQVVRNFSEFGGAAPRPYAEFLEIEQELIIADQVIVEKRLERIDQDQKRGKKGNPEELALLQECLNLLESETPLRRRPEIASSPLLRGFGFLSGKPKLVLYNNTDEDDAVPQVAEIADKEESAIIRGKLECEIAQMSEDEADEFLKEFNISAMAADRVIRKTYEMMGLISFFTVGEDEVRAWTITRGTAALDAAEVIHSDIKKGFIRAECVSYDDLTSAGSYAEARKNAAVRLEGKTYEVRDGDVIHFRFNV